MTQVWLDTNVVLRFLTGEPPDLFRRARALFRRATEGEIVARLSHVTVAEAVWVLGSFYGKSAREIGDTLRSLVLADGIAVEDVDTILDALRVMAETNVAFVDAYVATLARRRGDPVASFDADFRRLDVALVDL